MQVYGFCILYVTSFSDIRYDNRSYAVVVQRKSYARRQISAPSVPSCVHANDLSFKVCVFWGGQGSTQLSRALLLLPLVCENVVKAGSSFKPLKLVRFKCS